KLIWTCVLVSVLSIYSVTLAMAGPLEDGIAAQKRGDWKAAYSLLKPLAEQGNPDAQNNLGYMYAFSKGGAPRDYAEAMKWFRKAANQGYAKAQANIGYMYEYGQGVPRDYAEAMKWYRKAADQGLAGAQSNLGVMYANGEGVPQDYAEAMKWYRKAADQGNAVAQNNLGSMYANGQGVPKDYAEAMKWWRKAANQGNADAQNNLRIMHAKPVASTTLPANIPPPVQRAPQPAEEKSARRAKSVMASGNAAAAATPRPQPGKATGAAPGSALDAAMRADIAEVTRSIRDNGFPGAGVFNGVYMGPGANARGEDYRLKTLLGDPTAKNIATKYWVGTFYYNSLPKGWNEADMGTLDYDKNPNAAKARRWFQMIADQIKANPNVPLPSGVTKESIEFPLRWIDSELATERQRNEAEAENARKEARKEAALAAARKPLLAARKDIGDTVCGKDGTVYGQVEKVYKNKLQVRVHGRYSDEKEWVNYNEVYKCD
ncbi:MAG: tetratricopeptide repeat protein, partial [Nitrospirota bacterium]